MKMNKISICTVVFLLHLPILLAQSVDRERPKDWENLIYGGRFMDRFLPMPHLGGMTSDVWGADAVVPRDMNNGIEAKEWSYWGGNIRLHDDGKYHLFVCRWPENTPKGHMDWPNSTVVHAVATNSFGPYTVVEEVGKGHNPEWYVTDDGKYVIYVIHGYYVSDNIHGPWEYNEFDFDNRDRNIIEGLSNLTFAKREDGSFIMICRGGGVWISKDGLATWNQLTDSRVYPPVDGRFEDPVIWKTDVQYHLIVNDWYGRIAWYLRSKDGINWKTDSGEAYLPGIARYEDNTKEDWYKYERIKMLQDKYGRATQANFAVIDTIKWNDLPNDHHSSKNIGIPLTVGKRMAILNKKPITEKTQEITVLIKAEEGFDPNTDMDLESLRFGAPEEVNFGKGCKVTRIDKEGENALLTFAGEGNGIGEDNFAAKLLGKDKMGKLLFGYSRLPGVSYMEPALSVRKPILDAITNRLGVVVENFGQVPSTEATLDIYQINGEEKVKVGSSSIAPIAPYGKTTLSIKVSDKLSKTGKQPYLILINEGKKDMVSYRER